MSSANNNLLQGPNYDLSQQYSCHGVARSGLGLEKTLRFVGDRGGNLGSQSLERKGTSVGYNIESRDRHEPHFCGSVHSL